MSFPALNSFFSRPTMDDLAPKPLKLFSVNRGYASGTQFTYGSIAGKGRKTRFRTGGRTVLGFSQYDGITISKKMAEIESTVYVLEIT